MPLSDHHFISISPSFRGLQCTLPPETLNHSQLLLCVLLQRPVCSQHLQRRSLLRFPILSTPYCFFVLSLAAAMFILSLTVPVLNSARLGFRRQNDHQRAASPILAQILSPCSLACLFGVVVQKIWATSDCQIRKKMVRMVQLDLTVTLVATIGL